MLRRYELTDYEWEQIKDLLPPENTGKRGRSSKNNHIMLNIIYLHGVFERITVLLVNKVETETRGHLSIFR